MFRKIPGFPEYGISAGGSIWDREEDAMVPIYRNGGYVKVNLRGAFNVSVHKLVFLAYKGSLKGKTIEHLDGNTSNNHVSNLDSTQARLDG